MMEEDEDDPVVKEIPVYICKELSDQLYLFQFPCRSADSNHYTKNIISSRVKPQSGIVELDYALDTKSSHYDKWVGGDLASDACCTKQAGEEESVDEMLMDKLTLQSQRSILKKDVNCYSVATIYDGKFCISSLHDSLSFLPSYQHKERTKKAHGKDAHSDAESMSEDEAEEATPAVQVTVKFSQKSVDKAKISQEQSHQQHLMKTSEEPWCETTFYSSTSSTAQNTLEGLTNTVTRNRTPMMSLTEKQYLDVLIPPDTSDIIE